MTKDKRKTKSRPAVLCVAAMAVCAISMPVLAAESAGEALSCPKLEEGQLPALVFIDGSPGVSKLCVTAFGGGKTTTSHLVTAVNMEVSRLGRTILLVNLGQGETVYAMDLGMGAAKKLFAGKGIYCLRSEPGRGVAMLAEWDKVSIKLIELDLKTFATKPSGEISRDAAGAKGCNTAPANIRISPDFKRIAYACAEDTKTLHQSRYGLWVMDLATKATLNVARGIRVDLPDFSSSWHGLLPFEWLDDDDIVYQDMEPNTAPGALAYSDEMMHVFKTVDVNTKAVREVFRIERRMALDGGSMVYDPVTKNIVYDREWFIDMHAMRLVPRDLPFEVRNDYKAREASVMWGEKVLYRGNENCLGTCISPSGLNFAYSLRPRRETLVARIYAKVDGIAEPVRVAEGPYAPTSAIAWIEQQ